MPPIPRINQYKSANELRLACVETGFSIPVDEAPLAEGASPLNQPIRVGGFTVGNRWAIHPMEGWDATLEGKPTDYTLRRWQHFGQSGAKLIWGGEAVAVRHDGRANPNQLFLGPAIDVEATCATAMP